MLCDEEEDSPKVCYSVQAQTVFDELSNFFFVKYFSKKKKSLTVVNLSVWLHNFATIFFPCLYEANFGFV